LGGGKTNVEVEMKQLGGEAFERARQFLIEQARPLERAFFKHRLEGATMDGALAELARFQNRDGGFGLSALSGALSPNSGAATQRQAGVPLRDDRVGEAGNETYA
jgi:hypothetical protein